MLIIIFYICNLNLSIWLLWGRERAKYLGEKERGRGRKGERVSEHVRDQRERERESGGSRHRSRGREGDKGRE
jgi:hypothetical protein